jgi:hypothetical protein
VQNEGSFVSGEHTIDELNNSASIAASNTNIISKHSRINSKQLQSQSSKSIQMLDESKLTTQMGDETIAIIK